MIYLIVFIILFALALRYDFSNKYDFSSRWYNIILLLFIAIAGFRYRVGGDTLAYFDYYQYVNTWNNTGLSDLIAGRYSFLWNALATTCKTISEDFFILQLAQSTFINIVLFWFIKRYSNYRFTCLLIYFTFAFLYFNMEIMRESIAIAFLLLAYPSLHQRNWVKYYLLSVVAFLFHPSAIIIFIFPLFSILKFNIINLIVSSALFVSLVVLISSNSLLINLFLITDVVERKYNVYSQYEYSLNGKIYITLLYYLFPLYLIRVNSIISKGKKLIFADMHLIYFITVVIYISYSGFSRFLNYLTPFMIIYFAEILNNVYNYKLYRKVRKLYVCIIFILALTPKLLYYTADTSELYPDTVKFNLYYPYSTIFNKTDYYFRDVIFYDKFRKL